VFPSAAGESPPVAAPIPTITATTVPVIPQHQNPLQAAPAKVAVKPNPRRVGWSGFLIGGFIVLMTAVAIGAVWFKREMRYIQLYRRSSV
jgi:hypothetical protein